jgi:hypothetical protein
MQEAVRGRAEPRSAFRVGFSYAAKGKAKRAKCPGTTIVPVARGEISPGPCIGDQSNDPVELAPDFGQELFGECSGNQAQGDGSCGLVQAVGRPKRRII